MSTLAHHLGDALVKGVGKGDVANHAALEVSPWPHALGTVNDLVGDDKVTRLDRLLETADSREGNDAPHPDGAQGGNVCAGRDLVRGELVVRAVAAQECDGDGLVIVLALVVQDGDWRGGLAPGCWYGQRSYLRETGKLAEASATDNRNADGPYARCD